MVVSLDKKWKEVLFGMTSLGPNFMAILMGAYFSDAVNPAALTENSVQAISGVCLILPAVFPILWFIAKIIDGIIDIPLASITDRLSTKLGRRRPPILVCFLPMVLSYCMCWFAIGGTGADCNQVLNTIWMCGWAVVFFISYSMSVITFYGSIASICTGEAQRSRVTAYKSFFDTITYCIVYALVPLLLKVSGLHINKLVLCLLPLMLTILIPVFLIKEGEKYGYPENKGMDASKYEKVGFFASMKVAFSNKLFMKWVVVDCCALFGLQMFLTSMNALIIGGMGFDSGQMAVVNTSAFAPVPVMIYLLIKLKNKKGLRFAFQTCLIAFGLCILSFDAASLWMVGTENVALQYVISISGGLLASWAIGALFMFPYLVPAQVGGVERQITGKDHSSMYFATRIVCTTIVGAFGSSLVYDNIKNFFISKQADGVVYATGFEEAANAFNAQAGTSITSGDVYNLGLLIVPLIVFTSSIIGFFVAFRLPKDFSATMIAQELKKQHPEYDISGIKDEIKPEDKTENIFVMVALWVLTGGIFGFIWSGIMMHTYRTRFNKNKMVAMYLLSSLIPFFSIYAVIRWNKDFTEDLKKEGIEIKDLKVLLIISAILLPILPMNPIALAVFQNRVNKSMK